MQRLLHNSANHPELSAVLDVDAGEVVHAWITENRQGQDGQAESRTFQCGLSGALLTAAMREADQQTGQAYADDFFAFQIFRSALDPKGPLTLHLRKLRETELRTRKLKFKKSHKLRAELTPNITPEDGLVPGETLEIERFAWDRFFPALPYFEGVDVTTTPMQEVKTHVLRAWQEQSSTSAEPSSFDGALATIRQREDAAGHSPISVMLNAWVSFALHRIPKLVERTAEGIVSESGMKLSTSAELGLRILYGAEPLAGGSSLFLLSRSLEHGSALRKAVLDILNSPNAVATDGTNLYSVAQMNLALLLYLDIELADLDRQRRTKRDSIPNAFETVPAKTMNPAEECASAEQVAALNKMLNALPKDEQMMLKAFFGGLGPKDIASCHPEWSMTPKQVSDKVRYLVNRLREEAAE